MSDKDYNVDSRLSRLETIIENVSEAVNKIQNKLDTEAKINWAPIAIGVTVFFTVAGSISTIYNARITTLNTAVEAISERAIVLEKGAVERQLKIENGAEKIMNLEEDVDKLEQRVDEIEKDKR